MEAILNKVAPPVDHPAHAENPFTAPDVYFKVSPRLFAVLPSLPATSREILRFILFNLQDGKVYMPTTSLLVHSKIKSEALIRAGIDALVEHEVIALHEGDSYWVNFISPAE